MDHKIQAYRASLFHITRLPESESDPKAWDFFEDGLLVVEDGCISTVGNHADLKPTLSPDIKIWDHRGSIIMPGLVDTHIHYPQTDIIASHGKQLIDWLKTYTFPCESRFSDKDHARSTADVFIREMLSNGTTSALVLATVHPESVDALFEAATPFNLRLCAGKVMMDKNAPSALCDTVQSSYEDSLDLIERWHGKHRFTYAVTPRFALTSSEPQLEAAGALVSENPDVLMHTHLSENRNEVDLIARAFPWSRSYLDVYDRFGLVCDRSVFAHGIYLDKTDRFRLFEKGAAIAHCPTSNLFLGSGLFDLGQFIKEGLRTALATDVGGGTSFSLFKTMAEAYKVAQLQGFSMSPVLGFYLATLGAAKCLHMDHRIGNFETGKDADFIVINPGRHPLLKRRVERAEKPEDILFALMILGDDRMVEEVYVRGDDVLNRIGSDSDVG